MRMRQPFLKVLILAILISEGELHGYLLHKRILHHTCMRWKPSIGTIYRVLNEMVEEGLVLRRDEGRRHSYVVTRKGIEYFIRNSEAPLTRMAGVMATLLNAYLKVREGREVVLPRDLESRLRTLKEVILNVTT